MPFRAPAILPLVRVDGLYVKDSPGRGRGLFCHTPLSAGTLIERAPLLVAPAPTRGDLARAGVQDYTFSAATLSDALARRLGVADKEKAQVLALGAVSFCNHMMDNNAEHFIEEDARTPYLCLKALRNIPAEEEICINYGVAWLTLHNAVF